MSTFQLLIKEQRVIEMERQVQAMHPNAVSYDISRLNHIHDEDDLYDRIITHDAMFNVELIMEELCPRQRAEFFTRVSVVNGYEFDNMTERMYMAEFKFKLYTKYLNAQ